MQDLYISLNDFNHNIGTSNELDELLHNRSCRILLSDVGDDSINKMLDEPDNVTLSYLQSIGSSLYSGKPMFDALKDNSRDVKCGYSRAMIFLHNDETELADYIENKYGILCIRGIEYLQQLCLKKGEPKQLDNKDENRGPKNWKDVFNLIIPLPCNSILINDHYLVGNHVTNHNLDEIIDLITEKHANKNTFHILIICSDDKFDRITDESATNLNELLRNKISNVILEFVGCKQTKCSSTQKNSIYQLWKETHDRFAYSNYTTLEASHQLTAFYSRRPLLSQKLYISNIPYGCSIDSLDVCTRDIAEGIKEKDSFVYLKKIIENGEFICSDDRIDNIQNRLIVDQSIGVKEGEKCCYLSVPDCNNWAETKILHGMYHAADYSYCIIEKYKKNLYEKQRQIQELFKDPAVTFDVPNNNGISFCRITVPYQPNIKAVKVIVSTSKDELKNQRECYSNNCFLYEFDAMCMTNKIAKIIGISQIYSEETLEDARRAKEITMNLYSVSLG